MLSVVVDCVIVVCRHGTIGRTWNFFQNYVKAPSVRFVREGLPLRTEREADPTLLKQRMGWSSWLHLAQKIKMRRESSPLKWCQFETNTFVHEDFAFTSVSTKKQANIIANIFSPSSIFANEPGCLCGWRHYGATWRIRLCFFAVK